MPQYHHQMSLIIQQARIITQPQIGRVVIQVKIGISIPEKIINLEPSTPTKNIEKPFQDVEVETKPAIELIHQPPIVPKIVSVESSAQKSIRTITFCKTSIADKILKSITNHNSEKPANKQKRHDQCDE